MRPRTRVNGTTVEVCHYDDQFGDDLVVTVMLHGEYSRAVHHPAETAQPEEWPEIEIIKIMTQEETPRDVTDDKAIYNRVSDALDSDDVYERAYAHD